MIKINPSIYLDENELNFSFIKASGPGGQNVNKVATSAQLKFDVKNSSALSEEIKEKLVKIAGKKMTSKGILIIEAKKFRTQERNKDDALNRLINLIILASKVKKKRKKTKPTKASSEKRIDIKKQKSAKKQLRKRVSKNTEL